LQPPARYPNFGTFDGFAIAVVPFDPRRDIFADPQDPKPRKPDFDWFKAGVCPTRFIFANDSSRTVVIDPGQITGTDVKGVTYKPFTAREAADAALASKAYESYVKGAVTGALLGAAMSAGVGAAASAIGGGGAGRGAAWGAILGGASGLILGGAHSRGEMEMRVRSLINTNQLTSKTLTPGMTHDGVVYFPAVVLESVTVPLAMPDRQPLKARIPVSMPPQEQGLGNRE
jgi:hypothetical protein